MPLQSLDFSAVQSIVRQTLGTADRDVKAVHGDVTALLNAGLLSKTDDGMIVFPYDAIHVDFMLKAA